MEQAQLLLKRYHWVLTLLCLALLAHALGRSTSLLIEGLLPAAPVPFRRAAAVPQLDTSLRNQLRSRPYYDAITDRNLFNSNPPSEIAPSTPTGEIAIGQLSDKVKVRGTIVGESSSMALIEVLAQHETSVFLVGDLIMEGAEIIRIQTDGVIYKQREEEGFLPLQDDSKPQVAAAPAAVPSILSQLSDSETEDGAEDGIEQISPTEYVIDERELQNQLANINQLILQARVVPNFNAGKIDGFKIFAIKPNSIFRKLGLRNGDVLLTVNGVVLDNPQKGLQVFQDLQGQRDFSIDLRRRNENMTFRYDVR